MNVSLDILEINEESISMISGKEETLIFWLKCEYHPKILTDEIYRMINNFNFITKIKKKPYYKKLLKWIRLNKLSLESLKISQNFKLSFEDKLDKLLLKRFLEFLNDFSILLGI